MPLIRDGKLVEDPWFGADDAAALERPGDVIVTAVLWREHRARLLDREGRLGLKLANDEAPEALAADLGRFALIALEFPKFTDGRAYSQARLLRERFGFKGELRAVGEVLSDQLAFMRRCGFDAFEIADERALHGWQRAVSAFSAWYQPAGDRATPVPAQRWQRRSTPGDRAAVAAPPPDSGCAGHWAY